MSNSKTMKCSSSNEFNFEQGREKILDVIRNSSNHPVLVAIYGLPNSGKSYLIDSVRQDFKLDGVSAYTMSPKKDVFEIIKENKAREIQLFHCGWGREQDLTGTWHEDPNMLSRGFLKRELDLNVGIYNPNMYKQMPGYDYDIIIANPDSQIKNADSYGWQ